MNDGWWVLLMFMYLYGDLEDCLQEVGKEAAAIEAFEDYAKDCQHLELDNDGRATHHICRHPIRDDLSNWVMCDRHTCPFMMVNAFGRGDHPCEGCTHLKWEADMGKHLPYCEIDRKYDPDRCDRFKPSKLYSMYMEII